MSFFASSEYEKGVIKELKDWTHLGLNVPNEFFNGLPPVYRCLHIDCAAIIFNINTKHYCFCLITLPVVYSSVVSFASPNILSAITASLKRLSYKDIRSGSPFIKI